MPQKENSELALQLGHSVRRLRRNSGMTQAQLATKAELHQSYLVGIEAGTRNVTLRTIASLAKALNVGVGELFNFSAQVTPWPALSGASNFRGR